jgi:hypothetical protein
MRPHHLIAVALTFGLTSTAAAEIEQNSDRPGGDFKGVYVNSAAGCETQCRALQNCRAWTFVKADRHCMLKNVVPQRVNSSCCASGVHRSVNFQIRPQQSQQSQQSRQPKSSTKIDNPEEGLDGR